MSKNVFQVFFREKPAMMLVEIKNSREDMYASILAKQTDCTYSHVVRVLQNMERARLINFNKQGRSKFLTLTPKGQAIAECIDNVKISL